MLYSWIYLLYVSDPLNFRQFNKGVNAFTCQLLVFYNDLKNGQNITTTPRWIGIDNTNSKINDTKTALNTIAANSKNLNNTNDTWTTTDPPAFEKMLSNAYSNHSVRTLPNANPVSSQVNSSTISPVFAQTYGNYTNVATLLYPIYQEYQIKINASINLLNQSKSSANSISTYQSGINDKLTSIQNNIGGFNTAIATISNNLIDSMITLVSTIFKYSKLISIITETLLFSLFSQF